MNSLLAWLMSPEWIAFVKTLLHSLWQAGGLALLLWFALRHVTNPVARYRLTLGTLAAVLGTTLLTWALLNQSPSEPTTPDFTPSPTVALHSFKVESHETIGEPSVAVRATPIPKPADKSRWNCWLALAWLLGATLMFTRAAFRVAGAERLRRSCVPLEDSRITPLLAEAQRALHFTRRIRVAVTDKLTSPAVVGVILPTLILPLTLLTTLTPEQISFILLHELAHIQRGDYLANLFQLFIEALLFFNPAVWWISHQVRREREVCCDALAIKLSGAPVEYARTLVHVAEVSLHTPPAAAPAFSENQREPSSLADRVQRLLVPGYRPALRLTWRAMLAAIVVGGVLLFLSAMGARNVVGAVATNTKPAASETTTNAVVGSPVVSDKKNSFPKTNEWTHASQQIRDTWTAPSGDNRDWLTSRTFDLPTENTRLQKQWFYNRVDSSHEQAAINWATSTTQSEPRYFDSAGNQLFPSGYRVQIGGSVAQPEPMTNYSEILLSQPLVNAFQRGMLSNKLPFLHDAVSTAMTQSNIATSTLTAAQRREKLLRKP